MPVKRVKQSDLPPSKRISKILRSAEWKDIQEEIGVHALPPGEALQISLSKETLDLFRNPEKAIISFILRLRKEYEARFLIRQAGDEIIIENREKS